MQSVVTGQAPITLERKITSGGKQINTEDDTHNNWNKSYTSDKNKKVISAYVCIICETSRSRYRNQGDSIVPTTKRQVENKRCPNRNRKKEGREEKNKDKSTSATQERKKTARKGNTHTSGSQGARGGYRRTGSRRAYILQHRFDERGSFSTYP